MALAADVLLVTHTYAAAYSIAMLKHLTYIYIYRVLHNIAGTLYNSVGINSNALRTGDYIYYYVYRR